jgi:hypothetical protein
MTISGVDVGKGGGGIGTNTRLGTSALVSNTSGANNTALGYHALRANTTGCCNTAAGANALCANTSGVNNVALGNSALRANTTGGSNAAVGLYALTTNTGGASNTAFGSNALRANTTGNNNSAFGINNLRHNTTGVSNLAMGTNALYCNTTGANNVAIGVNAAFQNIGGCRNVAIGTLALYDNKSGNFNIAIGYRSQLYFTRTNIIAIGCCAYTSANNHTVWGGSDNSVCNCVYAEWSNVSDCRDKAEIETLSSDLGLNLIRKLRPVSFKKDHRDTYVSKCGFKYGQKDGTLAGEKEHYGLIAQELHQALNELDARFDALGHDENKDAYRLTYAELSAPIIKSIQELDERLKIVEARLDIQS